MWRFYAPLSLPAGGAELASVVLPAVLKVGRGAWLVHAPGKCVNATLNVACMAILKSGRGALSTLRIGTGGAHGDF